MGRTDASFAGRNFLRPNGPAGPSPGLLALGLVERSPAGPDSTAVSQSGLDEVRDYIRRQQDHHRCVSFQDEYRAFLRRYDIVFDERYVWD